MLTYCIQDVKTNLKLYEHLQKMKLAPQAVDLELRAASAAVRMQQNGFAFDMKAAGMLQADLAAQREEIHKSLRDVFPTRVNERYSEKTGKRLKDEVIEFNPGSRDHIAYWFKKKYDWKPKVFTNGGKPMIDEEILEEMEYPEAKQLVGYFMLEKRLGMLSEGKNAWMSLVKSDGRIHGRINTNGAATGRCTHSNPNMAQVPSVRKPYGKECRQLFTVPKGYKLVGTDLSGIELRCLAHYLALFDNGEYAKEIIEGDIHTRTQEAAGLPTRDAAKTFTYALLYGAGDAKMGTIVGGGRKEGKEMKEKFFTALPAFKKLATKVAGAAERGYLIGLDSRRLPVRSPHAALNTLLQGAAAQIAKLWLVRYEENCEKEGWVNGKDFWFSTFVHDEIQATFREDLAERAAEIAVASATQAGDELGMRCRVDAEAKIGNNWYDTH
jgi:DNA polymerase I